MEPKKKNAGIQHRGSPSSVSSHAHLSLNLGDGRKKNKKKKKHCIWPPLVLSFLVACSFPSCPLLDPSWQFGSPGYQELKAEVAEVPAPRPEDTEDYTGKGSHSECALYTHLVRHSGVTAFELECRNTFTILQQDASQTG